MNKSSGEDSKVTAIVVGAVCDEVVKRCEVLFRENGIEFVLCEDVFMAVGLLAGRKKSEKVFVIGNRSELGRENGRLFEMGEERGFVCCCVEEEGLEKIFGKIGGQIKAAGIKGALSGEEDVRPSEAEIDALLGC